MRGSTHQQASGGSGAPSLGVLIRAPAGDLGRRTAGRPPYHDDHSPARGLFFLLWRERGPEHRYRGPYASGMRMGEDRSTSGICIGAGLDDPTGYMGCTHPWGTPRFHVERRAAGSSLIWCARAFCRIRGDRPESSAGQGASATLRCARAAA